MLSQLFTAATLIVSFASAQTNVTIQSVTQAFDNASIVPDVLPSFSPVGILDVVFLDNTTNQMVNVTPGMNLTREQNALRPTVSFQSNVSSFSQQTFVLAMVDPDAPTPQNASAAQIRHLLAPNITLNGSLANGALLVNNTPAISDFLRPTPPAGSDPHRYILLLFVQPDNFTAIAPMFVNSSTPISNFNISLFASETGLGDPVAGNFFFTGPDNTSASATSSSAASTGTSPSGGTSSAMGRIELNMAVLSGVVAVLISVLL